MAKDRCRVRFLDDEGIFAWCVVDADDFGVWIHEARGRGFSINGVDLEIRDFSVEHDGETMRANVLVMVRRDVLHLGGLPGVRERR